MEKTHKIEIKATIELSDQDIDDLMVAALEGGINYWCGGAEEKLIPEEIEGKYDYASELISRGGVLELTDAEDENEKWDLNLSKFMNGVKMVCEANGYGSGEELIDNHDAGVADSIVQYALFGEIVFG